MPRDTSLPYAGQVLSCSRGNQGWWWGGMEGGMGRHLYLLSSLIDRSLGQLFVNQLRMWHRHLFIYMLRFYKELRPSCVLFFGMIILWQASSTEVFLLVNCCSHDKSPFTRTERRQQQHTNITELNKEEEGAAGRSEPEKFKARKEDKRRKELLLHSTTINDSQK